MAKKNIIVDVAVQVLYAYEITSDTIENIKSSCLVKYPMISEEEQADISFLLSTTVEKSSENDILVTQFLSAKWSIERLSLIERIILRLGITEIFEKTRPTSNILRDYTAIAKHYGDDKSAAFVNGILDNISRSF